MFTNAQMNTRLQINVNETQSQQGVGVVAHTARVTYIYTYIGV